MVMVMMMRDRELSKQSRGITRSSSSDGETNDRKQRSCKLGNQEIEHARRNSEVRSKRAHEHEVGTRRDQARKQGEASPDVHGSDEHNGSSSSEMSEENIPHSAELEEVKKRSAISSSRQIGRAHV